jgi:DNA-directed RNA polymerase subunit beta'
VRLHERISVRLGDARAVIRLDEESGHLVTVPPCHLVTTTVGRVLFNQEVPERMPFYDVLMTAGTLQRVVTDCDALLGRTATVELLDRLKTLGFRFATRGGLSFAVSDLRTPTCKDEVIRTTRKEVEKVHQHYLDGDLTSDERSEQIVDLWTSARDRITDDMMECMAGDTDGAINPVLLMARSGARGGKEQLRQLAGMRGLIARPSGEVVETPITSSFREGLNVHEYFRSTLGARKGLADTALKTSEAGHLTRRLVDVAQDVVVTCHDCGTTEGILKEAEYARGRVLLRTGKLFTDETAQKMVRVRSPLNCAAPRGVCQMCYGTDLATGKLVEIGTTVGVIAAQSIGEPGTQLTMRTFHIGGVHTQDDITRGLPRVVELFEAWQPERVAVLAERSGPVRVGSEDERIRGKDVVFVKETAHVLPPGAKLVVKTGDRVKRGQPLTKGVPAPKELLRLCGKEAVQDYLMREVRAVYSAQNVRLDDRHIEIILARMLSRVKVLTAGDTDLLPGAIISKQRLAAANEAVKDGCQATVEPVLLGVARAAVLSDSFLSAASFQETTRVLTSAALAGKVDLLEGLKENVIVGRLVPAGTGYRS